MILKNALVLGTFLCAIFIISCTTKTQEPVQADYQPDQAALIERGRYLVNAIGCDDCHSPKRMGPNGPEIIAELRFSGYPANEIAPAIDHQNLANGWILFKGDLTSSVGPWGQSFAANITSDATGIGNWSQENFITALRKGKYKGMENGRDLLPPMPWFSYKNLTDEDLKSIFAFLKSTNPVNNVVPAPVAPSDLQHVASSKGVM